MPPCAWHGCFYFLSLLLFDPLSLGSSLLLGSVTPQPTPSLQWYGGQENAGAHEPKIILNEPSLKTNIVSNQPCSARERRNLRSHPNNCQTYLVPQVERLEINLQPGTKILVFCKTSPYNSKLQFFRRASLVGGWDRANNSGCIILSFFSSTSINASMSSPRLQAWKYRV